MAAAKAASTENGPTIHLMGLLSDGKVTNCCSKHENNNTKQFNM
jgi:bisphosphoglycerate-independent phosphoglycerate mutase (AlkP superfamily)